MHKYANDKSVCLCRPEYWFWDSITLWQAFFLVLAQVFAATSCKGTLIQLTSMLVILVVGHTIVRPLGAPQSQAAQVPTCYDLLLGLATATVLL